MTWGAPNPASDIYQLVHSEQRPKENQHLGKWFKCCRQWELFVLGMEGGNCQRKWRWEMKRSKGGGNEIELSPFWTQLCTFNPCEAKRLAFKQLIGRNTFQWVHPGDGSSHIPPRHRHCGWGSEGSQAHFPQKLQWWVSKVNPQTPDLTHNTL